MTFFTVFPFVYVVSSIVLIACFLHLRKTDEEGYRALIDEAEPFNVEFIILICAVIPVLNTIAALYLLFGRTDEDDEK